jgi:hypothetical protein
VKRLTTLDLLPPEEYERNRAAYRSRIIHLKQDRRISIGERVTLVFENRDTLLFQVQEMIRAESIRTPERIQEELDVYNAQIPETGELSATLLIEVTDPADVQPVLDGFKDLDKGERVALVVGPHTVYGEFEQGRSKEDKISAVHYVRFRVPPPVTATMKNLDALMEIAVHHPGYQARASVPDKMRVSLLQDLDSH